ncbi:uncharacterized protein BDR25DRAFT_299526 [Lindgomyces ingoldianus]|uniref:Uncharacterized protein n=1 Tax=Lindgomyces ingoldianus TaxID=673940 RepID=A0ACB6REL6_9PLEO|nr:uncharacterized protein BDR25DRAFT_299526 [Lindgomyces ingoldianus]KAF2477689.1 hypothetical protein BDR25DRAFT_299526 [Lindgomyces ingoldianus]
MSPSVKLGLLTLVSTAAAIPHYGHSKFHHKPSGGYGTGAPGTGAPYPTGGWGGNANSTALPLATGTGAPGSKTTTILETLYSTMTEYSTIYATHPKSGGGEAPSSVGAADVSTGAAVCGPATVYVTATNKVTVTIGGGAPSSAYTPPSSIAEPASSVPASSAPVYVPLSSVVAPSSSAPVVSFSFPEKPASTPPAISSVAPVSSAAPISSAPVPTTTVYSAPVSSAPASSSAPKPSSAPTYSGSKRGLAYNEPALCSAFGGSKFGFAYNWASTQYGGSLPEGIKFVPMMHKPADATPEKWLQDVDTAVKAGTNVVMGFNEPDHPAQANLTLTQACSNWTNYMEPIVSAHPEVTILGPSVTNGPAPMGLDWLSRFKTACPGATWHAANIHFYDQYDDKVVDRFISHCEEASKSFGKPIWVTEFGLNPGTASSAQAADFLKKVMAYMDNADAVKGYAYFMVGTGENQLNSGNGLSATGEVYASA